MTVRTAVLIDERDRRLGACQVQDATSLIEHNGVLFVRQNRVVRLTGGGLGAVFLEREPVKRERLSPL